MEARWIRRIIADEMSEAQDRIAYRIQEAIQEIEAASGIDAYNDACEATAEPWAEYHAEAAIAAAADHGNISREEADQWDAALPIAADAIENGIV